MFRDSPEKPKQRAQKESRRQSRKRRREVERMFGKNVPHDQVGRYCLVHLDHPSQEIREERIASFNAMDYFDCGCEMCQPFLDEGAYMVFDGEDVAGMRLQEDGIYQMVQFNRTSRRRAASLQ